MSPLIQLVCFCSSHTKPAHTILMLPWTTCCTTPYIVLWWDLQCTCIDMWIHGFHPIACHDRQHIDWEVSERLLTSGGAEGSQLLSNEICGMTRLQYVTRGKTTNWSASLKIKTGSIPLFRAAKIHENNFTSRIYQISAWESSPRRRWQYSEGEYRGIQKIYGKISERQLPWNEICGTPRLKDVIRGKNSNWSLDANALLRIINLGSTPLFRTARIQENRIISKSCNAAGEASLIEFREKFRDIDSRVQEVCVIHLFMLRTIAFVRDPGLVIWRRRLRSTGGLKRCQYSEHSNKARSVRRSHTLFTVTHHLCSI